MTDASAPNGPAEELVRSTQDNDVTLDEVVLNGDEEYGGNKGAAPTGILPYPDMPGTHDNEARMAGVLGVWAIVLAVASGLGPLLITLANTDGGITDASVRLPLVVGILLLMSATICGALAVWHAALQSQNNYALQVAIARNTRSLEGFDVDAFQLRTTLPDSSGAQE